MKKLLLMLVVLSSLLAQAQDSASQNLIHWPATRPELLLNKMVKIIDIDPVNRKYGYKKFHAGPDMKASENFKYEDLVGKTFKVTEVTPFKKQPQSPTLYSLKLESADASTIYYEYSPKMELDYYFEVEGGLTLPEGFHCDKIKTETDKFTGSIKSMTEMDRGNMVMKEVTKGTTKYFLRLNVLSPTVAAGKKGAIVLLANGKKIERPNAPVELDANTNGGKNFRYNSMIELTPAEIALLQESPITDIRLYIFDSDTFKSIKIMEQVKCLTKSK